MRLTALILLSLAASTAQAQYKPPTNALNPLGGPGQLQVNMNPNWAPALGDGRGLERDFSGRGLGNYKNRDFMNEVRMRNNLVTGNAVGGRSLMINRPYGGTDDFRASLGSDDLFSFRRDTIGTGVQQVGIRGTDSLQYQYGYTTANQFAGQRVSPNYAGGVSRGGTGVNPGGSDYLAYTRPTKVVTTDQYNAIGNGWNEVAPQFNTLRATSSFSTTRDLNPAVIGIRDTPDGRESLTASGLLGLRSVAPKGANRIDTSVPTSVQPRSAAVAIDPTTGKPAVPDKPDDGKSANPADKPSDSSAPAPGEIRTSYDDLLERFSKMDGVAPLPNEPADAQTPLWKARLTRLKESLDKLETDRLAQLEKNNPTDPKATPEESRKKREQASEVFSAETIRLIRQAGGNANSYGKLDGHDREMYARYMVAGSKDLAERRYFDAEEQFVRCLSIAPGDPTASAARINSQIGAALFLSAAINAKALFSAHPEVIGVRYTGETMPAHDRLITIAGLLRTRVVDAKKASLPAPRDASFLLAYIGFQLGDAAMTREGLDLLDETFADNPDPLIPVIRGVWLEEK